VRWRPPGLDGFRVAQDVMSGQGFLEIGAQDENSIAPEVRSAILGQNSATVYGEVDYEPAAHPMLGHPPGPFSLL